MTASRAAVSYNFVVHCTFCDTILFLWNSIIFYMSDLPHLVFTMNFSGRDVFETKLIVFRSFYLYLHTCAEAEGWPDLYQMVVVSTALAGFEISYAVCKEVKLPWTINFMDLELCVQHHPSLSARGEGKEWDHLHVLMQVYRAWLSGGKR